MTLTNDTDDVRYEVETAFVVYIKDGAAHATGRIYDLSIEVPDGQGGSRAVVLAPQRDCDADAMYRAVQEVSKDVLIGQMTDNVVRAQLALAQQLSQQQRNSAASKLHVPK